MVSERYGTKKYAYGSRVAYHVYFTQSLVDFLIASRTTIWSSQKNAEYPR